MTEKQLLQRITALEHGFEREAQAIAALDERIAQLELKYLDVQSGIEHSAAVQTGSGPASRANDIAVMAPVQFSSAVVTPDDSGAGAGPGRSIALSLNVDALLAGGGFLLILLLFLAMWSDRRKCGRSDTAVDMTDFTETHSPVKKDQPSKQSGNRFRSWLR